MKNNGKWYFIYLHSMKEKVPVTRKQFDDYYRDINAYRRTKQNHGECFCPKNRRLMCTIDCSTCPYKVLHKIISLDAPLIDVDGNEMLKLDYLQGENSSLQHESIEEVVSDTDEMKRLLQRLSELMPEAIEIGKLREEGLSEDVISEKIGIGRKTYGYRLKKVKNILKKEFPEFF